MLVIEKLIKAIRAAGNYNQEVQVAPACILWPDYERQWELAVPKLQRDMPELLVFGAYNPEWRTGPAIWLKCAITGKVAEVTTPDSYIPVIYLPGISRHNLRAVETSPDEIMPLVELQYRGAIWSQVNTKDWTVLAFLKSQHGGLGYDVAQDKETITAMIQAVECLLEEDDTRLNNRRLDKEFFLSLLTPDLTKRILLWLDQGEVYRKKLSENEWKAFVALAVSNLEINPNHDSTITGAEKLAAHEGPWAAIWERYCEAPSLYPNIPGLIRRTEPPSGLFINRSGWPQWNEEEENNLRRSLLRLNECNAEEARERLLKFEEQHGIRREYVWAKLGEAPLAKAVFWLAKLAESTKMSLGGGNIDEFVSKYTTNGWLADDAMLQALACVEDNSDIEAVTSGIRSVYLTWLNDSTEYIQNIIRRDGYPVDTSAHQTKYNENECLVFVDGLRFDLAKKLVEGFIQKGYRISEKVVWSALPSVTQTGKPWVSPVRSQMAGSLEHIDFEPSIVGTNQPLNNQRFEKLLMDAGWAILKGNQVGNGQGKAWCEYGNIDHLGHRVGGKLARELEKELRDIEERVMQLLSAGWNRIKIITDHGWLLMPGGLPKVELPASLVENKWGRCAEIKPGALCGENCFPWSWNPVQTFALARGIHCYRNNLEYTHGGLSLQECLTVELTVQPGESAMTRGKIDFTSIKWAGLRCKINVTGDYSGLRVDIRKQAANPATSLTWNIKLLDEKGSASIVVEDESHAGFSAFIVLLDEDSQVIAQISTVIGGGEE